MSDKFRVGDVVVIKSYKEIEKFKKRDGNGGFLTACGDRGLFFNYKMEKFCGKKARIVDVGNDGWFDLELIDEDDDDIDLWVWAPWMIEKVGGTNKLFDDEFYNIGGDSECQF